VETVNKRMTTPKNAGRKLDSGRLPGRILDSPDGVVANNPERARSGAVSSRWRPSPRAALRRAPTSSAAFGLSVLALLAFPSCSKVRAKSDTATVVTVGVVKASRSSLQRQITLSSEFVPFQEIDVYAKESGFVKNLYVDYGSRVQAGQLMAVLEIPELQAQLQEDQASIKNAGDEVTRAEHQLKRYKAQYTVYHLEYSRLNGVFQSQPGLVAQQEVDDAQGKDQESASQVDAGEAALESAQSQLLVSKSKLIHDQALFDYSHITAPFAGVVTERYANLGTLIQAGIGSSTQVLPLVRLSQDDRFRLVIPVPESEVRFIRVGDAVDVRVPSLGRTFPGKVARFAVDVRQDTRTMHTEVDVLNPRRILLPGLYAEATLTLESRVNVLALPLQAVGYEGTQASVDVVNDAGEVETRRVSLGLRTPTGVEITSGIHEGDQVIVSDRANLKAGQKVQPRIVEPVEYEGQDSNGQ
jgi:RND family efflux transporter MFP subunit